MSQMTAAKVMHKKSHSRATRMRRTSSRRNICLQPGQNGRCTDVIQNSKVRISKYLDTSAETQMAQIMVQYGRPSRSSWAKSVWSSFGRTIMGKAIRESSIRTRLKKRFQKDYFCVCGRYKTGWEKARDAFEKSLALTAAYRVCGDPSTLSGLSAADSLTQTHTLPCYGSVIIMVAGNPA